MYPHRQPPASSGGGRRGFSEGTPRTPWLPVEQVTVLRAGPVHPCPTTSAFSAGVVPDALGPLEITPFTPPPRPAPGTIGTPIKLRANHFTISMPGWRLYHYDVTITPEKCPHSVNREVIDAIVKSYSGTFGSQKPVFDGRKNMYATIPLARDGVDLLVTLPSVGRARVFHVLIKLVGEVDLQNLAEALGSRPCVVSVAGVRALDVILSQLPSVTYTSVGRSFFFAPSAADLGGVLEARNGYHQSVHLCQREVTVNVDVSAMAFYKAQPVIEFMVQVLHLHRIGPLQEFERTALTKKITGLKVTVTHTGRKYRVCGVTSNDAQHQTFPWLLENGKTVDCSVADYFQNKYGIKLRYPELPCLLAGPEKRQAFLPFELCDIEPGQKCMKRLTNAQTAKLIRASGTSAPEREREINALVWNANSRTDPYKKQFGVSISNSMMNVTGRVLPSPNLLYGCATEQLAIPQNGVWDMRGKTFYSGAVLSTWALICFTSKQRCGFDTLNQFILKLYTMATDAGMRIAPQPCTHTYLTKVDEVEPAFRYLKTRFPCLSLVVVVLPGKTPVYAEVKRVGNTLVGVATQCVNFENLLKLEKRSLGNLIMKVNAKLGGINCIVKPGDRPPLFKEPVIFLGASVTHHSSNSNLSIAAVTGSMDAHPCRYGATVRVQTGHQEVIQELTSMVKEMLTRFYKTTHWKPVRIVMYRGAVPESQLERVVITEVAAIREACSRLETDYKPGLTYVVVQRRHHTRLFCSHKEERTGRSGNVPPGTTVDTDITHPTEFDFFLCSHAGIQGTSRPSHYRVRWDDNCFTQDELQSLTYQLCHTYPRCTRCVSRPAPLYYASLVSNTAQHHVVTPPQVGPEGNAEDPADRCNMEGRANETATIHAALRDCMPFL
ncbi:protein argonaute-2-like isoform X2 [Rhipicephalus microplus]|uniref:protein argonaute-2-like isoform X2 n=1 Tax=Rhipicephalus microplus TaxID=6941 RepID=UPI003F6D949B